MNSEFIHNFCFPFELELLCHDYIVGESLPKILFQVNSVDSSDRHRIEGYSFITIPIQNGTHTMTASCFKPVEDNYMRVFSYFLGGSRKIPDIREITKTSTKDEKVFSNNIECRICSK
jgi:hypothetical protein